MDLKNNSDKPVKNVGIKVKVGSKTFEMTVPEDGQILQPVEKISFGDSHLIRRGVSESDEGRVYLVGYSTVD